MICETPSEGLRNAIASDFATPTESTAPAPLLGQHTRELLTEFGLSDSEIGALIARDVVAQSR
jgi:crotonobetainyl-CoA:carnitine CoA-transferase CaiB-like acyl-CoA transferase